MSCVVKFHLPDQIRRISLESWPKSFETLGLIAAEILNRPLEEISFSYQDSDGDKISFSTDKELAEARHAAEKGTCFRVFVDFKSPAVKTYSPDKKPSNAENIVEKERNQYFKLFESFGDNTNLQDIALQLQETLRQYKDRIGQLTINDALQGFASHKIYPFVLLLALVFPVCRMIMIMIAILCCIYLSRESRKQLLYYYTPLLLIIPFSWHSLLFLLLFLFVKNKIKKTNCGRQPVSE